MRTCDSLWTHPLPLEEETWYDHTCAHTVPYCRIEGKPYVLPTAVVYPAPLVAQLREASEKIDALCWKTMRFVQRYMSDAFLCAQLGIDAALCALARLEVPYHGIARQDWIVGKDGCKCIEYNTDTPTGVPEVAYLAEHFRHLYAQHGGIYAFGNPSMEMNGQLRRALSTLIEAYQQRGFTGNVVFTSMGEECEDRYNTLYALHMAQQCGIDATYVPLESLTIRPDDGLYAEGNRIDILYRLYPLEFLPDEVDADGYPIGQSLIDLVIAGKLALINPPQSIVSQSKGLFALMWTMCERNDALARHYGWKRPLYTPSETEAIQRWLLPSYWSETPFVSRNIPYVQKSFFGREGRGTTLHSSSLEESAPLPHDPYYATQPQLFQQYQPMTRLVVPVEQSTYTGYLLTGVFVIGRKYSGILPRIGARITDNSAYFCPAFTLG